ncbi:MAG: hypothetical protein U1D30_01190 [Planctomycetota bacterium]
MNEPQKELSAEEQMELVSFLDGEADADLARRMEVELASNPRVQDEARHLRQSWDMLDFLPMPKTTREFTRRTLVVTRQEPAIPARGTSRTSPKNSSKRILVSVWLVLFVLCFLGGFALVRAWPDPNREILEDLSLYVNYDEYRAAGDIDFVRALRDQGILEGIDKPVETSTAERKE